MPAIDPVILELIAKNDRYNQSIRASTSLVESSLSRQERAVNRLETEWQRTGGAIGGSIKAIGAAAAGFVSIDLARRFLAMADSAKQIDAQLRLATQTFGSFNQAQADAQRIAGETRGGLAETSTLYGNFIRATEQIGGTQAEAARATETFSKALKIGGADANAAASATLQFGQALASGALRGDEFNSIAEASPRILRLLADAIGVPQGQLRKLAEEGKLTSDVLFRALTDRKFTQGIDDEFKTLPVTFSDAMTQVENAALLTFGAFDRGGEFSTALATFVSDGAEGFSGLGDDAQQLGLTIRAALETLGDAFNPFLEAGRSAFAALQLDASSFGERLRREIGAVYSRIDQLNKVGAQYLGTAPTDYAGAFQRDVQQRSARQNDKAVRDILSSGARRFREDFGPQRPRATAPPASSGGSASKKTGARGPSADTLARRAEADAQRQLRNDEAFANEKSQLEQDLLRARAANVTAAETLAAFERQEIDAQRVRQNASYQADVAQKRLTQARADELVAVNDKVAAERTRTVNLREQDRLAADRLALASSDLETARDFANVEGELADTQAQRKAAALRLLNLEFEQERLRLEAIEASRTSTDAEKEIARRRLASLDGLQAGQRAGVERQFEGPLARYRRGLNDPATDVQNAVARKLQDVDDAIANAAADTLGVKDPFLRQLLQIFLQQNVLKPLYDAVAGASGGGSGGFLGTLLKIGKAAAGFAGGGGGGSTPAFGQNIEIDNILGRASGGYVPPRGLVRVNEGGPGVELLRMGGQGGTVIPLGQADRVARPAQPMVLHQTINVDGRNSVTPAGFARQILDEANRNASVAAARMGQAVIKGVPARMAQYQGDGT